MIDDVGTLTCWAAMFRRRPMERTGNTTPHEHFRAVMVARTLDGETTEVIVTRQDVPGSRARVWLTFHGSWRGTVRLDGAAVGELRELLRSADMASPS
ncbi:MAG: hypothetical protein ACR2KO_15850 [Geodermatophilaceae bacterium]